MAKENKSEQPANINKFGSANDEINLPDELKQIIADLEISQEKKENIIKAFSVLKVHKATFSGPIPPPEILKGYNEVVQNGAERIISMAEKQSAHRMQLEDFAVKEELTQSRRGQVFGFTLGIVGMGLATTLAIYGHDTVAGIFGTTTIIGLVTVFVLGKKSQQKDLAQKNK